jgi:hypothetical protein
MYTNIPKLDTRNITNILNSNSEIGRNKQKEIIGILK